ncbi:uncharacterized protein CELE_R160.10 [Caenorhabditis elegans]|uniref:Uncharacterized protein n=1 Tax=Caenorhabditis elegans TaxID=6239 RepID=H8W3Y3_CAEEL|nr:Uncharacterized protein CELE_R160.10 [Caenorhabditis elegans]CCG28097.1 Uncharacterized protein CELE_R160.10 [Caenorhabditis elegans]|eukprot:NP_001257008.1 Uncharacterized protein CELE_R160.10 [Caenorhabditis elegans]
METAQTIKYHVPPMLIFLVVVLSCLSIGFLVDYIMQKYGCCGRRGSCCRPELEGDEDAENAQGSIPLASLGTTNDPLPGRLPLLSRAPINNSRV